MSIHPVSTTIHTPISNQTNPTTHSALPCLNPSLFLSSNKNSLSIHPIHQKSTHPTPKKPSHTKISRTQPTNQPNIHTYIHTNLTRATLYRKSRLLLQKPPARPIQTYHHRCNLSTYIYIIALPSFFPYLLTLDININPPPLHHDRQTLTHTHSASYININARTSQESERFPGPK